MTDENANNLNQDFIIVWLDSSIEKTKDSRDTKAIIRQLVRGRLLTFDNADQCLNQILIELIEKRIFFIVSNTFGNNVISLINQLPQIQSIYVYCSDRRIAEAWTEPYSKISGIYTHKQALLNKICDDIGMFDKDGYLPMSVFHLEERQNSLQNLTKESATFMWYRSILMVLRLMAKYCNSKTEMIAECRANYHNNEIEQRKINNFEENYCPTKAFWWYTYDSFVYRLLNKALRTQNIEIIFKFRFFINDLHNQIEQLYRQYLNAHSSISNHHLTVYRGQRLSMEEVDLLKRNVNQLISMNSFLSATSIQALAEVFADTSDQRNATSPLQSVIFIIDIFNMSKEMTPFAFIKNYSCCQDEEELLFSIGAIFKVQSVEQHNNMWHVRLQLCDEQNKFCQHLLNYMMKQIGSEPDPLSFGWFLYRMNEFNKAERYAKLMLKQLPSNDIGIGHAYNLLGLIYKDTNHVEQSVECYEEALNVYSRLNYSNCSQAIATRCNLGLAYVALGNVQTADEYQREAEEKLFNSSKTNNLLLKATVESLKAKLQAIHGDNSSALAHLEMVLEDKRKRLPFVHPSIASTLNEIGIVQENMNNNIKALECFQQALEIGKQSLPPHHFDLADYYTNIGRIYHKRQQYTLALKEFRTALKIALDYPREGADRISILTEHINQAEKELK